MKRFIICILLVVGLIWAGDWTFDRLTEVKDHVLAEIDGISQLVERGEMQAAWERASALQQDWEENEHSILAFVRHGDSGPGHPVHCQAAGIPGAMERSPPLRLRPTPSGGC